MRNPFIPIKEKYKDKSTGEIYEFETFWTNCLWWAVYKWFTKGGYLLIRKAKSIIPYPHFLWKPDETSPVYHVVPVYNVGAWVLLVPLFKGYVKCNDWNHKENEQEIVGRLEKVDEQLTFHPYSCINRNKLKR